MTAQGAQKKMADESRSRFHFVLVHGSCMGGWCWYKLVSLLQSAGHKATAVDLAAAGINPKQRQDLHTISDYFEPLMTVMANLQPDEQVVVVGHSMGGVAMSVAMEKFPQKISVAVFLTAFMPGPNLSAAQITQAFNLGPGYFLDTIYMYGDGPKNPPTSFLFGPNFLAQKAFQLSPPEDLVLAESLVRPFPIFSDKESAKESTLTEQNYGCVCRVFIVSEKDTVITKDMQLLEIQLNPPNEVCEIFGSDHMVMCSQPTQLCSSLLSIATKYGNQ